MFTLGACCVRQIVYLILFNPHKNLYDRYHYHLHPIDTDIEAFERLGNLPKVITLFEDQEFKSRYFYSGVWLSPTKLYPQRNHIRDKMMPF